MESKLKALKVVDLKDIIAKANVSVTGKANKSDLIAKILGSPEAIEVYKNHYGPAPAQSQKDASASYSDKSDKSEVPPKVAAPVQTAPTTQATTKPASKAAPKPAPVAAPAAPEASPTPSTVTATSGDTEEERRKARAARFGIPVVEAKPASVPKNGRVVTNGKAAKSVVAEDPDKLAARAARFGTQAAQSEKGNGRKRAAPQPDPVDEEELARRKKRAERFGVPLMG